MNLKEKFTDLCLHFTEDHNFILSLWQEIEAKYSEKGRHYHDLLHLENMFQELETVKSSIKDFKAVSFFSFLSRYYFMMPCRNPMKRTVHYALEPGWKNQV